MEVVAPAASELLGTRPQPIANSYESDRDCEASPSGPKLLAELDIPGNWSGKGQHVEFARHEAIPLEEGTFLGRGTFADVYEVKCRGLSMARKQIYCTRRMKIADVKRELDILKKLSHQHVVTLLGSYLQNKQNSVLGLLLHPVAVCDLGVFLEELDENQTLLSADFSEDFKKLMDRLGFRDDIHGMRERLGRVYGCLANAICYLHDNDIRHKDIKPRNILLDRNDGLYVTDFGLSRDTSDASSSVTDGIERGTYKYCAPEVARFEARGRAADVYSLGCVFLEITTVYRQLSLTAFEHFRTENDDRSYQNSPQRLHEWMSKLRKSRTDNIFNPIFDIVDIIGKMVSLIAMDRPVIGSVCSSLYLLGDLAYFGKCCPSRRYRDLMDQNTKLKREFEILHEDNRASQRSHELEKAAMAQEYRSEIDWMNERLREAEHRRLHELLELRSNLESERNARQWHLDAQTRDMANAHRQSISYYESELNRLTQARRVNKEDHNAEKIKMNLQFLEEKRNLRAELLAIELPFYDDAVRYHEKIITLNSLVATHGLHLMHDGSSCSTISQDEQTRFTPVANHDLQRLARERASAKADGYRTGHKRSTTIGGIFSRTNELFGGKRNAATLEEEVVRKYPPVSMRDD